MTAVWRVLVLLTSTAVLYLLLVVSAADQGNRLDYLESENVRRQDEISTIQTRTREYQQAIQELLKAQSESTAQIVLPAATGCTLHDIYVQNPGC